MPSDGSHASALKMRCGSGKTFTVRRDLTEVAKSSLIIVATCNRLFTRATCVDWERVYGEGNVYCYLDGLGKGAPAMEASQRLRAMCSRVQPRARRDLHLHRELPQA